MSCGGLGDQAALRATAAKAISRNAFSCLARRALGARLSIFRLAKCSQQGSAALIYARWHSVFEFAGFDAPPAPRASLVRREIQIRVHGWHAVRQTGRRESPCRVLRLAGCTKAPPAPLGCRADKLQIELATLRTAEDLVAWATWCCPPKTHCKPRTLTPSRKISKPNAARSKRWSRPRIADRKRATAGHVLGSGLSARGSSGGSLSKDPPQAGQGTLAARPLKAVPRLRPHTLRCSPPPLCRTKSTRTRGREEFTVPLCRTHHRQVHERGDERPIAQQEWSEIRG
jgi:hypothetical protein